MYSLKFCLETKMATNDQDQTTDSDDDGTATLFRIKLEVFTKD